MMYPHEAPPTGARLAEVQRMGAVIPVIETERLTLRGPTAADFPHWLSIMEDGDTKSHILSDDATRERIWDDFCYCCGQWTLRGHGYWACDTRDGETAGFVGIGLEIHDVEIELGYLFRRGFWGKGLASEAVLAARRHAYTTLNLSTLVSCIDPRNTASARLAERVGARRDAAAEAALDHDIYIYRHPAPEECLS